VNGITNDGQLEFAIAAGPSRKSSGGALRAGLSPIERDEHGAAVMKCLPTVHLWMHGAPICQCGAERNDDDCL
jgi:hypothetical protein